MKKKILAMVCVMAMVVGSFAACGAPSAPATSTPAPTATTAPTQAPAEATPVPVETLTYTESPELAKLVAAGTIPAVENRIPNKENVFIETTDATGKALSIGVYGGNINILSGGGSWDISRPVLESIIHYNTDGTYYANVIKSYEVSADYKVWTFHLREGMKWSDGDDFNADDITFWYYMCHLNNLDSKKSWTALKDGDDKFAVLTKVDDYTVTWTFENPKYPADFIENGDFKWCWAPSHILKNMIPDAPAADGTASAFAHVENPYWPATGLTDEQALANAAAKGWEFSSVKDFGKQVTYYFWNISGLPTLNSYVLTTKEGNNSRNSALCILERNAYFWKVDAKGQQLPYCENIYMKKTEAEGQDQLMFRSGELDVISVAMADIAKLREDLGSKANLKAWSSTNWGSYQITFNYTTTDEKYATLYANKDFRQAMSICVDRETLSGLVSDGFLDPAQCAPAEGNFGYDAEWIKKWTEFDAAKAKTLLEGCGLKMGADGFYTFADGSELVISFYEYEGCADEIYPILEQYFRAVGIKTNLKNYDTASYDAEIDNNTWSAVICPHTSIGGLSLKSRVAPFVPVAQAAEWYGEYGTYYQNNGASGVKPTGDMAKLVEIYEKWNSTPDTAERDKYALEIYNLHKENLWSIAYLTAVGEYLFVNSEIQNYPDNLISDDLYQYSNITHFWTLYKQQ